ncbi:hypothetical protein KO498_08550 [Lentibacter algarum]|uniref:DUF6502 family protein n=1 Tax=Lentibacter algarum TaxID=576131 RepID=UPI001C07A79A|nr:DUF6502 family protein [Lentibacter algarum]MBU2981863.1 hypothetical protein [Lentibacter algarum]
MLPMLDHILAPLARLLVARGVVFSDLVERLKGHYVQAATEQSEGKTTDSRLSVMTGLQRRDIARLRAFEHKQPKPNPLTRLVALWQSLPEYSSDGAPKLLPRTGDAPSFESLARTVRQDVHPRAMLDALFASGTVKLSQDSVELVQTAYVPLAGSEEQLDYLAANVGDHLAAAADNVLAPHPPHFERAAHYTGLSEAQIKGLQSRYDAAQMALLEEIAQDAERLKAQAPAGAAQRFRAGGYFFSSTENANEGPTND